MLNIRLPNITGNTPAEQLSQIKSYLYQFAEQLQWAMNTLEAGGGTSSVNRIVRKNSAGAEEKKGNTGFNFNELKSFIIKSADIIEAYYDEIEKLLDKSGKFVAKSEYGTFVEETRNTLYADDTGLKQQLDNYQAIFDEDGNIKKEFLVNGHIYSGIIEYARDGEAIIGIEIGQTTKEDGVEKFNKFARFTAEKLAFYDPAHQNEPVAYISNYRLVITDAWVKGNLKLGSNFILDTSNGIALRPV